jgi:hypothetical protein
MITIDRVSSPEPAKASIAWFCSLRTGIYACQYRIRICCFGGAPPSRLDPIFHVRLAIFPVSKRIAMLWIAYVEPR